MRVIPFILITILLGSGCHGSRISNTCTEDYDCFANEICESGQCVVGQRSDAGGDGGIHDAQEDTAVPDITEETGDGSEPDSNTPDASAPSTLYFVATGGILDFESLLISLTQTLTVDIIFAGSVAVEYIDTELAGDFEYEGGAYPGNSGDCPGTIAANCQIALTYRPNIRGPVESTMKLNYLSQGTAYSASLTLKGNGLWPAELGASPVHFSPTYLDDGKSAIDMIITNEGDVNATIVSTIFTGGVFGYNSGTFPGGEGASHCETIIPPDSIGCLLTLKFEPTQIKDYQGEIKITYNNQLVEDVLEVDLFGAGAGYIGNIGAGLNGIWWRPPVLYPRAITRDYQGNLWVTDTMTGTINVVHKFDSAGTYVGWIGNGSNNIQTTYLRAAPSSGTADMNFNTPNGIGIDTNGNLLIVDTANHRVQKWIGCSGTGADKYSCTFVGAIGNGSNNFRLNIGTHISSSDRYFKNPEAITIDSNGNLFITDTSNNRVQKWAGCNKTSSAEKTECTFVGAIGNGSDNFTVNMGRPSSGNTFDRYFGKPIGISVDTNGNLFIVDPDNNRIQKWENCSGTGNSKNACTFVGAIGNGSDNFKLTIGSHWNPNDRYFYDPREIQVDNASNLFISEGYSEGYPHRIQKWSGCSQTGANRNSCSFVGALGNGSTGFQANVGNQSGPWDRYFDEPHGISIDSLGTLFIADTNNYRIQKWTECSNSDESPGHCDYEGWLVGRDYTFRTGKAFPDDGVGTIKFSGQGDGYFTLDENQAHIVFDAAGNLFITDGHNNRIQKWADCASEDGTCTYAGWIGGGHTTFMPGGTSTVGSNGGYFHTPLGLALDSVGNLFVSDWSNHRVQKWTDCAGDGNCTYVGSIGNGYTTGFNSSILWTPTSTSNPGHFRDPHGIVVDDNGHLYIVDSGNYRVQKWIGCSGTAGTALTACAYIGSIGNGTNFFDPNHKIRVFSSQGPYFSDYPMGIVFDNGTLFIADSGNSEKYERVVKWTGCGGPGTTCNYQGWIGKGHITSFETTGIPGGGTSDGEFNWVNDLVIDPSGNLYIADRVNHRVQKWEGCGGESNDCRFSGWIGDGYEKWRQGTVNPTQPTSFNWNKFTIYPIGLGLDADGYLYVVEQGNARISKWHVY